MADLHTIRREIRISALCGRQIAEHLVSGLPYETCGVLRGKAAAGGMRIDAFAPIRNVAPDPLHHFVLDPAEWIRECLRGEGLIGLFHSHPSSPPVPSDEDLRQLPLFAGMFRVYLIGSPGGAGSETALNGYFIDKDAGDRYHLLPAAVRHG